MASRQERKARLRAEREAREQAEARVRRRRMLGGYAVGGGIALAGVVIALVLVLGGSPAGKQDGKQVFPEGGDMPTRKILDLVPAARAAGCQLRNERAKSREHSGDIGERIPYSTDPPMSGRHFQVEAQDGLYQRPQRTIQLVHSLEHGRLITWVNPTLARDNRAAIRAMFDEDGYQSILTPYRMKYQVAASAWTVDPAPNGTGHLMTCKRYNARTIDALKAFRDEYRGNGPEAVP